MPLPEDAVSAGRGEGNDVAVYLSSRLDPAAEETGDFGYRVRMRDGAGHDEDLAIGLAARRPLVLVHNPMVPILEGGTVQLEAEWRQLDDASIDFQPAEGITTWRAAGELVVRCRLEDLRRDQDGDGLTDLEEERLLTDAWDRDTDGDGTADGDDRSPLGAMQPQEAADHVWVAAYRQVVAARAPGTLRLVARSGPRLDVGGDHTGRVLMLREDELGAYNRRFGLRAPLVIAVTMRGESAATVVVDTVREQETYDAARDANGAWSLTARPARRGRASASRDR
jgi:hypothetical protein